MHFILQNASHLKQKLPRPTLAIGADIGYPVSMTAIITQPDTVEKLSILSADARYDPACACGSPQDEHRRRIQPRPAPDGGSI
ncbi:MAG: hypothetical protein GXY41_02180 [Phycisphaerae bacterium]|nr:hypothetical protein [Phycisphaerae bacterium]